MSLTEVASGTLASGVGATTNIFNVASTPGIYVAKLNVSNYARWNPVVVGMQDALPDGTTNASMVYQNAYPKGGDPLILTPPFPTFSYCNIFVYTPTASANIPWSVLSLGIPTRVAHGSILLTGVAQQLGASVGPGIFMVKLDLGTMQNGDEIACFAYDEAFSGSAAVVTGINHRWANAQRFPVKHSIPMPVQVTNGLTVEAWQSSGTFRTIGYEILKLG